MITDLKALFNDIYNDVFNLLPTSTSIKPVHVANGLGRALVGRTYDSDALAHFLRRSILNQKSRVQEERFPNGIILNDYGRAFTGRDSDTVDSDALSTLRSLAEGVLAADKAVFSDAAQSSYTLSNEKLLTRDPSDHRCGIFLAELLTAGQEGDAATHIRDILLIDDDPWSTLAMPMMQFAQPSKVESVATSDHGQTTYSPLTIDATGTIVSPTLRRLRASLDRLARFEQNSGSKLNSLRRMVMFSCFVIHVHLISRYSEVVDGAPHPPILIDMFDGSRTSLRNASRASLRAAGDVLETLILRRIRDRISEQVETVGADQMILNLPARTQQRIRNGFDAYRHDDQASELEAISEAFWQVATEEKNHPVGFLTELGRRAGYLTPWANSGRGGRLQKRYGITTEFLETLVAATVEPDQPLDFPEFLDKLRINYGIVAGQRTDDQIVRHNNLSGKPFGTPTSVNEEDLRLNVEALRSAILEAGYAKAYADGQTVITTDPESLTVL
ncbi:hypothetical protein [Saccharothrix australiensis]|uniref:Uncharacterized protein n=1 Tax=Saccharothrix australiensis TaxID=2072 RepID=A0A495VUE5_9PSEU|nr:hypothetical protein [Saccharothrix australiensis]RKT52804.1 hypothetical protein C8E97_1342 [Saccharothrix australiensis]